MGQFDQRSKPSRTTQQNPQEYGQPHDSAHSHTRKSLFSSASVRKHVTLCFRAPGGSVTLQGSLVLEEAVGVFPLLEVRLRAVAESRPVCGPQQHSLQTPSVLPFRHDPPAPWHPHVTVLLAGPLSSWTLFTLGSSTIAPHSSTAPLSSPSNTRGSQVGSSVQALAHPGPLVPFSTISRSPPCAGLLGAFP